MSIQRAYLDYNASAPLRPQALEAMVEVLETPGNASSVHAEGRRYRKAVETARREVARLVNADASGVVFTGSATEAAHLALTPEISSNGKPRFAERLYVLATEHPCILSGGRFASEQTSTIPVRENGLIDMGAFEAILAENAGQVPFVAVQMANSETGIIQPVAEVARLVRLRGGYLLCDAVQAVGRINTDIRELGADFLLLSAHKIGGPQGVGALVKAHETLSLPAAIRGGGQENNMRAGTENAAAIAGFGYAASAAAQGLETFGRVAAIRDSIEACLAPICSEAGLQNRLTIFGHDVARLANTVLFSVKGLKAETALIAFDLDGVAVSSGSACSSGKVGSSHVLEAMGVEPEIARGAIRASVGWNSTQQDVDLFAGAFRRIARRLAEMTETDMAGAA